MNEGGNWSFVGIWNQALDAKEIREYEPRTHIWASELGGSYYDRYWKMKGRKPTTPPNLRSRRKFEGGNLTEWIVQHILNRAGILTQQQQYITYEGILKVTGKCDFEAGGNIFVSPSIEGLPETFTKMAQIFISKLEEKYPHGLRLMNLEIKSCSGVMFDRYLKAPNTLHALQAFHYAYNTKRPTMLVYVSRDDFRIAEWIILPGSQKWLKLYLEDIKNMEHVLSYSPKHVKEYYKEYLLKAGAIYNDGKFTKNWRIEYSNYLTDYGYKRPDQYADEASSIARRLNNIVKKIKGGKPIDGKVNVATLEECYKFYPGAENIIKELEEKWTTKN